MFLVHSKHPLGKCKFLSPALPNGLHCFMLATDCCCHYISQSPIVVVMFILILGIPALAKLLSPRGYIAQGFRPTPSYSCAIWNMWPGEGQNDRKGTTAFNCIGLEVTLFSSAHRPVAITWLQTKCEGVRGMQERTWIVGEHELSLPHSGSVVSFISGVHSSLVSSLRTSSFQLLMKKFIFPGPYLIPDHTCHTEVAG